ncbi:hypothetical protein MASSI9I_100179 [Massilia sp. 9I]|nr:hypothetical protein MASSI9I_100179 [Massilia sp. 9I]
MRTAGRAPRTPADAPRLSLLRHSVRAASRSIAILPLQLFAWKGYLYERSQPRASVRTELGRADRGIRTPGQPGGHAAAQPAGRRLQGRSLAGQSQVRRTGGAALLRERGRAARGAGAGGDLHAPGHHPRDRAPVG